LWAIYDSLIHFDKDMNPQPGLAKSWTWPSPTQLRLELIEGNRFHDETLSTRKLSGSTSTVSVRVARES
jgi:ABC-type transport system substrate-binding protein